LGRAGTLDPGIVERIINRPNAAMFAPPSLYVIGFETSHLIKNSFTAQFFDEVYHFIIFFQSTTATLAPFGEAKLLWLPIPDEPPVTNATLLNVVSMIWFS
jgi:hypothetical protein